MSSFRSHHVQKRLDPRLTVAALLFGLACAGLAIFLQQDDTAFPPSVLRPFSVKDYNEIQTGMAYEEVVSILGNPGDNLSTVSQSNVITATFRWKNPDGSSLSLVLQNNRVVSKSEQNLPAGETPS